MPPSHALGTGCVLIGFLVLGLARETITQPTPPITPAAFVLLVERYRRGDLESLSEVTRWKAQDVARAARAARIADQATGRAAVVFEIDLARSAPEADVVALIESSRSLADTVARGSDAVSDFRREVILGQVACLLRGAEFERAGWLLQAALHTWPADPDLLLARGSLYQTVLGRRRRHAQGNRPSAQEYESLSLERLGQQAAADFERVLSSEASQPEARLRLGGMLILRQKYSDARPMLERSRREADHVYLRYLASLFLGQLFERTGQRTEAELAYRDAYQQYPAAQAATLLLARLLVLRGAYDELDTLMLAMFEARHASADVPDPWRLYEFGQFWRLEQRMARLRALIR